MQPWPLYANTTTVYVPSGASPPKLVEVPVPVALSAAPFAVMEPSAAQVGAPPVYAAAVYSVIARPLSENTPPQSTTMELPPDAVASGEESTMGGPAGTPD